MAGYCANILMTSLTSIIYCLNKFGHFDVEHLYVPYRFVWVKRCISFEIEFNGFLFFNFFQWICDLILDAIQFALGSEHSQRIFCRCTFCHCVRSMLLHFKRRRYHPVRFDVLAPSGFLRKIPSLGVSIESSGKPIEWKRNALWAYSFSCQS